MSEPDDNFTAIRATYRLQFHRQFTFRDATDLVPYLAALGVSPSGVNLLLGTAWWGLGVWGIRSEKGNGAGWILLYVLCLLGGILTLSKAFALF